jgi:hypothetical protein
MALPKQLKSCYRQALRKTHGRLQPGGSAGGNTIEVLIRQAMYNVYMITCSQVYVASPETIWCQGVEVHLESSTSVLAVLGVFQKAKRSGVDLSWTRPNTPETRLGFDKNASFSFGGEVEKILRTPPKKRAALTACSSRL